MNNVSKPYKYFLTKKKILKARGLVDSNFLARFIYPLHIKKRIQSTKRELYDPSELPTKEVKQHIDELLENGILPCNSLHFNEK